MAGNDVARVACRRAARDVCQFGDFIEKTSKRLKVRVTTHTRRPDLTTRAVSDSARGRQFLPFLLISVGYASGLAELFPTTAEATQRATPPTRGQVESDATIVAEKSWQIWMSVL